MDKETSVLFREAELGVTVSACSSVRKTSPCYLLI
jgi:hypothetical protein